MYKDKVVLVTGSSRGVGLEIANHFLKHQATVIGISKGNSKIENPNYHHFSLDTLESNKGVAINVAPGNGHIVRIPCIDGVSDLAFAMITRQV